MLAGVIIPPDLIILALIYFVLSYFLIASLMAGIGSVVESEEESRQFAGIASLFLVIPFFFIIQFINEPNGTIPTILSLFPFTAGSAMIFRVSFSVVPLWQIALSILILLISTIVVIWAAAKVCSLVAVAVWETCQYP